MSKTDLMVIPQSVREALAVRNMNETQWNTLSNVLYPDASPASALLVWDYCAARKLDPFKKPVHIVPMSVRVEDGDGNVRWVKRETVLPGIYEYRITASRTGEYLGHDEPEYGPEKEQFGVVAPEWCRFVAYRWNQKAQMKVAYPVRVLFNEACGTKKRSKTDSTLVANGRWERAPKQMLTKCAEAAALREAFPEEIGGVPTVDEIEDHMPDVVDVTPRNAEEPSPILESLSAEQRETLDKAFGALKMSKAQALVKINEFIKPESPSEGFEKLVEWCRDEFAERQGRARVKTDNSKQMESKVVDGEVVQSEAKADPKPEPKAEPKPEPAKTAPAEKKTTPKPEGGKKGEWF